MADHTIELLESHTSFKGQQRLYRDFAEPLGRDIHLEIYVPVAQMQGEPCMVLYYLPSLRTSAKLIATQSDYQRYANRYDTIVVIPDVFSAYSGSPDERIAQYWSEREAIRSYLLSSLPEVIDHQFTVYDQPSIMGYGFGGTIALNLALTETGAYRSVSALAPWVGFYDSDWFGEHLAGKSIDQSIDPLHNFIARSKEDVLPIWIDQGYDDEMLGAQIQLERLEAEFAKHPQQDDFWVNWRKYYDHSFYFVHSHILQHFVFHAGQHEDLG